MPEKLYFLIEYISPEDITGFQFTIENIGGLHQEDSHNFYDETDLSIRQPSTTNINEKDPVLTPLETTPDFRMTSAYNDKGEIHCWGYYYGTYLLPATSTTTTHQSLCAFEINPKTLNGNFNPVIKSDFKLVNLNSKDIVDAKLRIRNYTNSPKHLDIYLTNNTGINIEGFKIELNTTKAQFVKYETHQGMVGELYNVNGDENDYFILSANTNTLIGVKSTKKGNKGIKKEWKKGLLASILYDAPIAKDIKILSYQLLYDGLTEELDTIPLDYDRERPVDAEAVPDDKACIEIFTRTPNEKSPSMISAMTTLNDLSITLNWRDDFFYDDYDKIEIFRKVFQGTEPQLNLIKENNDTISNIEIFEYSKFSKIENYFLMNGAIKLATLYRDSAALPSTFVDKFKLEPRVYYEYVIRATQNQNVCEFSNLVMEKYCPLASLLNECPVVYLEKNTAGTTNLSERRRYSTRVRSWTSR